MEVLLLVAAIYVLGDLASKYRFESWSIFIRLTLILCLCSLWMLIAPEFVHEVRLRRF